jgi:hypothetical protein
MFLQHLTYLLVSIKPIDMDKHILELREAAEKIGLTLEDPETENSFGNEVKEISPKHYTRYNYGTFYPAQLKKQFPDSNDPQLRKIMQEIAIKTSPTPNIILIEQKRDRLLQSYITLFSCVQRYYFNDHLANPEISDALKYFDLKGLFEINHFQSSTFEEIVYPHRRKLAETASPSHSPVSSPQSSAFSLKSSSSTASVLSALNTAQQSPLASPSRRHPLPLSPSPQRDKDKLQRSAQRNSALFFSEAPQSPTRTSKVHWAFHPEHRKL